MPATKRARTPRRQVSKKTLNQRFLKASVNQNIEAMRENLATGADINAQDRYGRTALEMTALRGTAEALTLLLEYGADPHHIAHGKHTTLMIAAYRGDVKVAQLLLAHGVDANALDVNGKTALDIAIDHGHAELAKFLAPHTTKDARGKRAAQKSAQMQNDGKALVTAAQSGDNEAVRALLDQGMDPDFLEHGGITPLYMATLNGQQAIVELLLERGASPEGAEGKLGRPLCFAVSGSHTGIVKALLQAGADPKLYDHHGSAPIHYISRKEDVDRAERVATLQVLLTAGANPNAQNADGNTPLHRITSGLEIDIVQQLLAAGADPNIRNSQGQTTLEAIQSHFEATRKQLERKRAKQTEEEPTLLDPAVADALLRGDFGAIPEPQRETLAPLIDQLQQLGFGETQEQGSGKPKRLSGIVFETLKKKLTQPPPELDSIQAQKALIDLIKSHGAKGHAPKKKPRTPSEYLKQLCAPTHPPEVLRSLYRFEDELRQQGLSLGMVFGLVLFRTRAYDGGVRPTNCLPFARARGRETHFALWRASKTADLVHAPIVMYSPSTTPTVQVIAEDLRDFLSLILSARRASILSDIAEHPDRLTQPKASYEQAPAGRTELQRLSRQLRKQFDLKQIRNPGSYIRRCRKKYPEVAQ